MKKRIAIIILTIILLLIIVSQTTLGRYIYNGVNNHILESQDFYFNSTILTTSGSNYSMSNWDGVNPYVLTIDLTSKKNETLYTTVDIKYDIFVDCPSSVICTLNKERGIITPNNKVDSYTITITPLANFYEGDSVIVNTSVTSNYPYTKTLSTTYVVSVENYGFAYNITDSAGSKYLILELTNSKPYYEVKTAFGSYNVGDHVSLQAYQNLSNIDKAKCISHTVTISFDPSVLLLDVTNNMYLNNTGYQTQTIRGYNYINRFSFNIEANANEKILFYKIESENNYNLNNSTISVSVGS